jgi:cyanophycinase-like exopeptidase
MLNGAAIAIWLALVSARSCSKHQNVAGGRDFDLPIVFKDPGVFAIEARDAAELVTEVFDIVDACGVFYVVGDSLNGITESLRKRGGVARIHTAGGCGAK